MTENEAIIQLNFDMEMIRFNPDTGENLTLEQIKAQNEDNYKTYLADEMAITALMENQQYHAIGTVEEFKALEEKAEPKNIGEPYINGFGNKRAECPICQCSILYPANYCKFCGQKLDWS